MTLESICILYISDFDECEHDMDCCDDETTTCVNSEGGYICECKHGYEPIVGSSTMCQG